MKAKISRGGDFGGILRYVHDVGKNATGDKCPTRVGGNMSGEKMQELAGEFAATRALRPDCTKPVWHCSLTLPEGEHLTNARWDEVSRAFMQEMKMNPDRFLYDVQRHVDTDHDHVHIVASRIGLDGTLWHGQKEMIAAIAATQKIEKTHGLTLTPGFSKKEKSRPTDGELNSAIRTGIKPPRLVCQEAIDAALQSNPSPTVPQFIADLKARGVDARASIASTGTMNGFAFEVEGIRFKGSKLGDSYKWAALQKRGVTYDKIRDAAEIANPSRRAETAAGNARLDEAGPGATTGNSTATGAAEGSRPGADKTPAATGNAPAAAIMVQQAHTTVARRKESEAEQRHRSRALAALERTREQYFQQSVDGKIWSSRKTAHVAFRDTGSSIIINSQRDGTIRAGLAIAAAKYGTALELTGPAAFRQKAWLLGSQMGLEMMGYDPTAQELAALVEWRKKIMMNQELKKPAAPRPPGPTWEQTLTLRRERKSRDQGWQGFVKSPSMHRTPAQRARRQELIIDWAFLNHDEVIRRQLSVDELQSIEHKKRAQREIERKEDRQAYYLRCKLEEAKPWNLIEKAKLTRELRDAEAAFESARAQLVQLDSDEKEVLNKHTPADIVKYRDAKEKKREEELEKLLKLEAEEERKEQERKEGLDRPASKPAYTKTKKKSTGWTPPSP